MYALVEIQGKQYRVEPGVTITVDRLYAPEESAEAVTVEFDSLLLVSDDAGIRLGAPYVTGGKVRARIADQFRGRKILVYKYKKRKNYRRRRGHRQQYTRLVIEEIIAG